MNSFVSETPIGALLEVYTTLRATVLAAWAGVSTDRRTGSGLGFRDLERIRFGEKGTETGGDYPGILWKWDLFMYSEIQIASSNCMWWN